MLISTRLSLARVFQCAAQCGALMVLVTCAHADDAQNHFDAGVKMYRDHKTEAALDEFNRALKLQRSQTSQQASRHSQHSHPL